MSTPGLEPCRPSIETYHRMAELGIPEDARVELLDGVIVEMTPIRRVDVFSEPVDGDYRRTESIEHGQISSSAVAGLELGVDELWRAVLGG